MATGSLGQLSWPGRFRPVLSHASRPNIPFSLHRIGSCTGHRQWIKSRQHTRHASVARDMLKLAGFFCTRV